MLFKGLYTIQDGNEIIGRITDIRLKVRFHNLETKQVLPRRDMVSKELKPPY